MALCGCSPPRWHARGIGGVRGGRFGVTHILRSAYGEEMEHRLFEKAAEISFNYFFRLSLILFLITNKNYSFECRNII